jgi:hypothetical protein
MKSKRKATLLRYFGVFACVSALEILAGCSTVDSTSAASFGSAATATSQQADTTFAAINTLTSQNIIEHASEQPYLSPSNFFQVVPSNVISGWDNAFSAMSSYAQALSTLTSSGAQETAPTAISNLASNIEAQTKSEMPAGLNTIFVDVATALEKAKNGHDAYEVAVMADPSIQKIVQTMADTIGATNGDGLRHSVALNYRLGVMTPLEASFSTSKDKLSVAKQYATVLDQRKAADLQLVSLRSSILALGTAHHAIATKSLADFTAALATINQQLALAQKALSDLNQPSTGK